MNLRDIEKRTKKVKLLTLMQLIEAKAKLADENSGV